MGLNFSHKKSKTNEIYMYIVSSRTYLPCNGTPTTSINTHYSFGAAAMFFFT